MDLSRYADLFLTESREHLSAINHALLELERTGGSAEALAAIFRAVHTVKGMSATMGYAAVAELSHELEGMLDGVRRGDRDVSPAMMDVLFLSADALERAIEASVADRQDDVDLAPVLARLRAIHGEAAGDHEGVRPADGTAAKAGGKAGSKAGGKAAGKSDGKAAGKAGGGEEGDGGWLVSVPAGKGMPVRVRLAEGTPLRGVRAFMIVQAARRLGEVRVVSPPLDALQNEAFGHEFALRLVTRRTEEEVERELLAAGDVVRVEAGTRTHRSAAPAPAPEPVLALPAEAGGAGGLRQQRHVRIDLRRLDNLMNLIGELVITRGRLVQLAATSGDPALDEAVGQASRLISDLQDDIMTSRMVPVWQVFDRFPRLVRDAGRAVGKTIEFSVEGKEIEVDRSMLDEIGDPIVHLLRNAIDHGIESPAERKAAGKPAEGRLVLSAFRDRSSVLIRVSDDGRGIDRARVLRRAQQMGLVESGRTELSDEELIRLISRSGFSTAEKVTDLSGRGVGMDTVQSRVRALGGAVDIRTVPGEGTRVTARLPVTLAIIRALLARVAGETYALPLTHISETVLLDPTALRTIKGREVLMLRDDVLPLIRMRERVRLPAHEAGDQQVVVLDVATRRAGLVVDELRGQQEIVVKQFDAVRDGLSMFSGATILGDGAPALIVDLGSLV
ncbi:MAG TPA: chemotaxis protein CheA [Gemmatimonadaceae bacterium]|nr:chemotaxis protein CheA [Gemmatimonadaceae bacterium]